MIVITDSNIIFSALITPKGVVAQILNSKSNIQFFAPNYILEEVNNHFDKILELSTFSKIELINKISFYREKISMIETKIIPKEIIIQATEIVKDIDEYDMFFVALHLYKKHKIWTSDKVLIK
jgi:predicted nucleic acid-binding protein